MNIKLLFLLLLISSYSIAENVMVYGNIKDIQGRLITNAIVREPLSKSFVPVNANGEFKLYLAPNKNYNLIISALNYYSKSIKIQTSSTSLNIGTINLRIKKSKVVIVEHDRTGETIEKIKPPELGVIPSSTGNFEDFIKLTGLGVSSNNELTSNYNVRGGNYDENLIYVNGIEIYRPFLTRSGQQEGLSFINSAFVENIYFSAGGFDSNYGDKLSSVLDVKYREAKNFGGSFQASLMGVEFHIENVFGKANRGNYILGGRYRSNSYLLNALPTQGDYFPKFFDFQTSFNYYTFYESNESYQKIFGLGHIAKNNYLFIPRTKTTQWGTVNEAYQLKIFYEGQEQSKFLTFTGAIGYQNKVNKNLNLYLIASSFNSNENENYDVLGEYWINTLETDPSKDEFGDSTENVGVGGFLNHARNNLNVWIGNVYHNGSYQFNTNVDNNKFSQINWGVKFQHEQFNDVLSEWSIIDSSGYIIPLDQNNLSIDNLIKTNHLVFNNNYTGYLQYTFNKVTRTDHFVDLKYKIKTDTGNSYFYKTDTIIGAPSKWSFTVGSRFGHRSFNKESWITPRGNITYTPKSYVLKENGEISRRSIKFKYSTGLYFQPPTYREMRDLYGQINENVISQKSWHNVLGMDIYVQMWGRPFKIVAETFYKHMWDINTYELENVKIRYYANNNTKAYAYGFDAKINGEFIKGVESYFKIGILQSKEDLLDDSYFKYYNDTGAVLIQGNPNITDSTIIYPGYIPRPTEQLINFSIFFQDKIPNYEFIKVAVNMQIGSPLPFGPPTFNRYQDILRSKAYYRVDLGIIYDIIDNTNKVKFENKKVMKQFDKLSLSLNTYNLLSFKNVISYTWLQDIYGRYYAIPNNLTGFRFNLKLVAEF